MATDDDKGVFVYIPDPDDKEHKTGDKCGSGSKAKKATVQWTVGRFGKTWTGTPRPANPSERVSRTGSRRCPHLTSPCTGGFAAWNPWMPPVPGHA